MAFCKHVRDSVKSEEYMTPQVAFDDIAQFAPAARVVWDPFYGDGAAEQRLQRAFPNSMVVHEDRDAFTWMPDDCDLIITNPPFSQKQKVLRWLVDTGKPFAVLLPSGTLWTRWFRGMPEFPEFQYVVSSVPSYSFEFHKDGAIRKDGAWFTCLWMCYRFDLDEVLKFAHAQLPHSPRMPSRMQCVGGACTCAP